MHELHVFIRENTQRMMVFDRNEPSRDLKDLAWQQGVKMAEGYGEVLEIDVDIGSQHEHWSATSPVAICFIYLGPPENVASCKPSLFGPDMTAEDKISTLGKHLELGQCK